MYPTKKDRSSGTMSSTSSLSKVEYAGLVLSVLMCFASQVMYATYGENSLVILLWLFGILAILITGTSSAVVLRTKIFLALRRTFVVKKALANLGLVVLILIVGFWLRLYSLPSVPQDLHGDMASYGIQARALMNPGTFRAVGSGWYDIPYIGFFPALIGLRFISNNLFGMCFISVIEGVLSLLGGYVLMKYMFRSKLTSFLFLIILAFNVAHIHFSRISAYMDPIPWMIASILLFIIGLDKKNVILCTLAGLCAGISLQMYYSGRSIVFFAMLIGVDKMLFDRTLSFKKLVLLCLTFLCGTYIALGPNLIYFAQHLINFNSRTEQVLIFSPLNLKHMSGVYGTTDITSIMLNQVTRSFGLFHLGHDSSTQFGYPHPMFEPILGVAIAIGMAVLLFGVRSFSYRFTIIAFATNIIMGGVMTIDPPFWPRLLFATIWGAIMASLGISFVVKLTKRSKLGYIGFSIVAIILSVFVGLKNWESYLLFAKNNGSTRVITARRAAQFTNDYRVCGFTGELDPSTREMAFILYPKPIITVDIKAEQEITLPNECISPKTIWLVSALDTVGLNYISTIKLQKQTIKVVKGPLEQNVAYIFELQRN